MGINNGTPVSFDYKAKSHFPYTGELDKVVIDIHRTKAEATPPADFSSLID